MSSVDQIVIAERLDRLLAEVEAIESRTPSNAANYALDENEGLRYELEHRLMIALQAMLDVSAHIAVVGGVRPLDSYRDAVRALVRLTVVDADLGVRLADAAGMRNILTHDYLTTDPRRVFSALTRVDDLRRFAASVWTWVQSS
ncbi:MAG: DUF86 domain-containing protein [Coriobacteriia bacterium]|nr:DUF86 domain-containing protein [Coriobacteriia bacterium]